MRRLGGGCLPTSPKQLNTACCGLTSYSEDDKKRGRALECNHCYPSSVCPIQYTTLCRYYQLMEQLQENLEEYDKLQQLASEYFT